MMTESIFKKRLDLEYFRFEEDFVEKNIRCIPMIVRFKMDAAGIKLRLAEWAQFKPAERMELAVKKCRTFPEISEYRAYLAQLVALSAGHEATYMEVDHDPEWAGLLAVPESLEQKANEFGWSISVSQWQGLTDLQRFALVKLKRPGHENKNFPKAMKEFGLTEYSHEL
jgi:hypothetical protein